MAAPMSVYKSTITMFSPSFSWDYSYLKFFYPSFETRQFGKLMSHYRFVHAQENGFSVLCSIDGCEKSYGNIDSFLKHIKRKHIAFHQTHMSKWKEDNRNADILESLMEVNDEHDIDLNMAEGGVENQGMDAEVDFQKKICVFLLQLREKYKLPAVVIPQIVNEIIMIISHHQTHYLRSLSQFLDERQIEQHDSLALKALLEESSEIENALSSLDSEYKINKFAKTKLGFVKPMEIRPDRASNDTYQYVPILETLKSLLAHDDIFSYVINNHKSTDTILRDFCDGDIYAENQFFADNPSAIQVMFYFDEFTAVNPLGHQIKNYKICGFYMLLGNLPPKFRSQLYCIQLVVLCMSHTLRNNGYSCILEPLINDLHVLENEGIVISKGNQNYTLYGTVSVTIADNLGAHSLGGFMESFNTLRNCRFCFISRDDMQIKLNCSGFNFRTKEMYAEQLRLVQGDANLSSVYGIKGDCALNSLNNYHVINGMPSDLAHYLFEGVACDVMTNVIKHCVTEGYFTLEYLNEQITRLTFSEVDKANKPSKVNQVLRKFSVKQSASQNWCFLRHLPLLVGNVVPFHDEKWECLLLLMDMLLYVCAPAFDRGHILVMSDVIEEFHESYRSCFPDCTFNTGNNFLSDSRIESTKGTTVPICLLNDDVQQLLDQILHGNEVFLCESVKYLGITYVRNTCVITGVHGALFLFSKIVDCAVIHGTPYLICKKLRTSRFERHFHAFVVSETNDCEILKISNLTEPNPLGIYDDPRYQIGQEKLVVPKYKIIN
ncbi:uncharacterized protein LOC133200514 [Saccostrea echinata]|uniref:uncharacterized protein LOC133200514 n=1 Tax=Saccostrea echinata TaxID=191078 RepID=UPI002A83F431|nr:uncharacterized protein LOC133200514 [Saccostrea echinata]